MDEVKSVTPAEDTSNVSVGDVFLEAPEVDENPVKVSVESPEEGQKIE